MIADTAFLEIAAKGDLSPDLARQLDEDGFIVIPGPVPAHRWGAFGIAYEKAIAEATADDSRVGSTTTRVSDFVNRGPAFDEIYMHPPLLDACCRTIDEPFKLSVMHSRTVHSVIGAQQLHMDFPPDGLGWPMIGFILMIDEFRTDNGATRFLPGSHRWPVGPSNLVDEHEGQVLACGDAGSMIVFNGSVWHGHSPNTSGQPRRSIQGAYIRRTAQSGNNLPAQMRPETMARISERAKYLIAI